MTFDPLVDERLAGGSIIRRDADDNPLIYPRGAAASVAYTRASALSKFLAEDSWNLSKWRERYLTQGIAKFPDLAMRAAALSYSTGPLSGTLPLSERKRAAAELDAIGQEAKTRAGINEAANMGTAGHSLTEPGCQGEVHELLVDVVAGYNEVTAGLDRVASEVFVANDELQVAGTFDSFYWTPEFPEFVVVGDTKTGKNYHQGEFEIQLAGYVGGEVYLGDPIDGVDQRLTFEEFAGRPVHPDVAYLVHTSVTGAPKARIVKLDLARGRRLAQLCAAIRDGRHELDHIGVGEKVDHRGIARLRLEQELELALRDYTELLESGTATDDEAAAGRELLRARGRALHARFKAYWTQDMTDQVKELLDG